MNTPNKPSPVVNVLHIETVHDAQGNILMCTLRGTVCLWWDTPEDAPKIPKAYYKPIPQDQKKRGGRPLKAKIDNSPRESPLVDLLATPGTKEVYGVYPSSDEALKYVHSLRWYGAEFTLVCTTGSLLEPEDRELKELRAVLTDCMRA